jgi:hypothetical protein
MSYFVNGFETAEELTPDASALFVQHSVELLALAESRRLEPTHSVALRDALFVRASRLISLRCGDPDLSSETIADGLGSFHPFAATDFAERDKTLMAHVWRWATSDSCSSALSGARNSSDRCRRRIQEIRTSKPINEKGLFKGLI